MLKYTVDTEKQTTIADINKWVGGTWLQHDADLPVDELAIDSRKLADPTSSLFVALPTKYRDGHQYINNAYQQGVRNFLVSQEIDASPYPNANIIKVPDTLTALQKLSATHRAQYELPCIGITGSNGKTVVKEWLYQLLSEQYNIVRNPKSYNSQIGVPLSVWLIEQQHNLAIFEAGISQPAEMANLERIIRPSIGVFTNIAEAHSEGFLSDSQKIKEKLQLFRNAKQLVYCKDYQELHQCVIEYAKHIKKDTDSELQLLTWSYKADADLVVTQVEKTNNNSTITAIYNKEKLTITIPFSDPASIENAIHCWCILLLLNIPHSTITARMQHLAAVSMRLELRHGINDCTFINDTYNSDITSLLIAVEYLEQQKQHPKRTLILSDILQIARPDGDLYEEIAELVEKKKINRFIGIGNALYKHKQLFKKYKTIESLFFQTTEEFLKEFHHINFDNEAILLKGARKFTFERISTLLEQKVHTTVLSINLSAIVHNLKVFKSKLKPNTKLMAMVKAFSYGSGSYEIAHRMQYAGADYLSVAYTDEGIALRKAGITMPIMVMSPDTQSFDRMIAWQLEPEIFNIRSLQSFISIARAMQITHYPVHIKLDTGMHRLGFGQEDIPALTSILKDTRELKVVSTFSHLAAGEDPYLDSFTNRQSTLFDTMCHAIQTAIGTQPIKHICNSAAIMRHPNLHYDMVRLGIGLYGIDNSGLLANELMQTGTLKTTIAQIRTVPAGEGIGYGNTAAEYIDRKIATISIGYADGYPRSLNYSGAYVLIHNKPSTIVGKICMDMCMVDVTNIPQAQEGDEVTVFGKDLPLIQLAHWANTIPYELMTGISQRVKRVYENE